MRRYAPVSRAYPDLAGLSLQTWPRPLTPSHRRYTLYKALFLISLSCGGGIRSTMFQLYLTIGFPLRDNTTRSLLFRLSVFTVYREGRVYINCVNPPPCQCYHPEPTCSNKKETEVSFGTSGGTTSSTRSVAISRSDLARWLNCSARSVPLIYIDTYQISTAVYRRRPYVPAEVLQAVFPSGAGATPPVIRTPYSLFFRQLLKDNNPDSYLLPLTPAVN
ncbi:hypothetical protein J6590_055549 [Homalodisca vitripennis]|nr:hypothetical protein J6590_055549 [Homalodisca vitripennis]